MHFKLPRPRVRFSTNLVFLKDQDKILCPHVPHASRELLRLPWAAGDPGQAVDHVRHLRGGPKSPRRQSCAAH